MTLRTEYPLNDGLGCGSFRLRPTGLLARRTARATEPVEGVKVSVFLEVEGAAHYLPAYAGNLDIMTAAGKATAEKIAIQKFGASA